MPVTGGENLTRTPVLRAPDVESRRPAAVVRCVLEVGEQDTPVVGEEEVLRLEVAVIYTLVMACLNGKSDLPKGELDPPIVTTVNPVVREVGTEVAAAVVIHHEEDVVAPCAYPHEGEALDTMVSPECTHEQKPVPVRKPDLPTS